MFRTRDNTDHNFSGEDIENISAPSPIVNNYIENNNNQ